MTEKFIKSEEKNQFKHEKDIKNKKINVTVAIVGTLIGVLLILAISLMAYTYSYSKSNKIIKGISLQGINVSGLTQEEAKQKIKEKYDNQLPSAVTVKHNDFETQISLEDLGASFNIDELTSKAYETGRNGNIFENMETMISKYLKNDNLNFEVTVDNEKSSKVLNDLSAKLPDTPVDSSYYIEGKNLIITNGKAGKIIDADESLKEIHKKIQDLSYANEKVELATKDVSATPIDVDKIHQEIYKEPVNAYYSTNPYVVHPHENGVDFKQSVDEVKNIVSTGEEEYKIPLKITVPSVTTSMIGTEAFPNLLGSYSTKYSASNKDRTTNLKLAAGKINGTVLMPGETFSYNKVVGERTIAAGYKEAPIYQNGEVVDGLGGGICQISTTLYNAALYANLGIVSRSNHMFVPSYAGAGRDATVVYGAIDFKFKNTRNYPIKINISVSGGVAKCDIFGLKENPDYDVEISTKIVSKTDTNIRSVTYKTVKQNGKVISSDIINKDTYKRHS